MMRCTVCGDEIGEATKYFVVLVEKGGYRLLIGCEHNMEEWERTLGLMPAVLRDRLIGVVASFDCLARLIKEHAKRSCEGHEVEEEEELIGKVEAWLN